jgi:hypothetical protein
MKSSMMFVSSSPLLVLEHLIILWPRDRENRICLFDTRVSP